MSDSGNILAINGGSSSVKFGLYSANGELRRQFSGKVDRIGFPDAS
jgi:acetate kinase